MRGLKQREIENCIACSKGVGHGGHPVFMRVSLEMMVLQIGAIRRHSGLEQMLGGTKEAAVIAAVMGSDEDMAVPVHAPVEVLVCQDCAMQTPLLVLHELAAKKKSPKPNDRGA